MTSKGQPQCTAMKRNHGVGEPERCRKRAMVGTTVCREHGGKLALASKGRGNVNFKHGRYSKVWADAKLQERYEAHLNDPELLAHRDEIALLDSLIESELEAIGVDAGTAERLWKQANDLMIDFEVALRNHDANGQQRAFLKLRDIVRAGLSDAEARRETRRLVQERVSVAEREARRLMAMQNILTSEQAFILFQGIMYEINDNVTNAEDRSRLNNRLMRLAGNIQGHVTSDATDAAGPDPS